MCLFLLKKGKKAKYSSNFKIVVENPSLRNQFRRKCRFEGMEAPYCRFSP